MTNRAILYPFDEDYYSEDLPDFISCIKKMKKKGVVTPFITVSKEGRISKLLKGEKLYYDIVSNNLNIDQTTFSLFAVLKLMMGTFPQFRYFRVNKIEAVHFTDLRSVLFWSNPAKMNRIPYFVSLNRFTKMNRVVKIALIDSMMLVCHNQDVNVKVPDVLLEKTSLYPEKNELLDFWVDRYGFLNRKKSLTKMTGLLNK
ncbi:MAG: hypothetical protein MJ250_03190 [Alphaproteobacteria bacterium]|nr:hypothetical protein [Alphaproteobacteria bacterium]